MIRTEYWQKNANGTVTRWALCPPDQRNGELVKEEDGSCGWWVGHILRYSPGDKKWVGHGWCQIRSRLSVWDTHPDPKRRTFPFSRRSGDGIPLAARGHFSAEEWTAWCQEQPPEDLP